MTFRFTDHDHDFSRKVKFFFKRIHGIHVLWFIALSMLVLCTLVLLNYMILDVPVLHSVLISIAPITLLVGFTIIYAHHMKEIVTATEFHNALLTRALELHCEYFVFLKKDGSFLFADEQYKRWFADYLIYGKKGKDALLEYSGLTDEEAGKLKHALDDVVADKIICSMHDPDDPSSKDSELIVSIDPILVGTKSRKKNEPDHVTPYFLVRAEKRGKEYEHYETELHNIPDAVIEEHIAMEALDNTRTHTLSTHYSPKLEFETADAAFGELFGHLKTDMASMLRFHQLVVEYSLEQAKAQESIIPEPDTPESQSMKEGVECSDGLEQGWKCYLEHSPIAIALIDEKGRIHRSNHAFHHLVTVPEDLDAPWFVQDIVTGEYQEKMQQHLSEIISEGHHHIPAFDVALWEKDNTTALVYLSQLNGVELTREKPCVMIRLIETTEQKNLEQRFAHSQKMQAVGQLAGGIAHDFNNLLTAMMGFCDLLLLRHPAGDPSFADLMQIKQNTNRAANLVRQLLAFSRKQTLQTEILDITEVLAELSNLIRRLIGENIELHLHHGQDLGLVKVDQGQLEQVIVNLAVNARDAMTEGGALTIRTQNVTISPEQRVYDSEFIAPEDEGALVPGEYTLIEVADTGTGIPRDIIEKIFDPFFSTKEVGSGTGLGLSTVYGIVKQTGGYIFVKSKEGEGTSFNLFFKSYSSKEAETYQAKDDTQHEKVNLIDLTGNETILLVEDEDPVRIFSANALTNKGYKVLEADSGEAALEIIAKQGDSIDLIISDVIMPGMNGPTMIEEVSKDYPDIKVVFISGYAEDAFEGANQDGKKFNFLPKPFTLKQLATKVREVLES